MKRQITFSVTQDQMDKIEDLAQSEARSKSSFIRYLILKKISEVKHAQENLS